MSFTTEEEIEAWIGTNGIEAFRRNTLNGTFSGQRAVNARAYLHLIDAENADARDARLVRAAEDAARAALDQADSAKKAVKLSRWALGIAIAAAFFTFCQWWFPRT
ncbi:hypothetical protein IB257_25120 [Achromobacter sp. ACM03]|uniref:hypothetical protein n=1 Tax=Achromobacter sp. ACM03 TaxID=2769300 RepID=UPI00177FB4C7|nr:hypothetical protein [Achromobacter sp. ACM03]MBD9433233.1 hypothetical protein [Achromobacter sp. ACM03]